MQILSDKLISDVVTETNEVIQFLKEDLGSQSQGILNFKENPKKWSAAECVEHMNTTMRHYNPEMEKAIAKWLGKGILEAFKPGMIGSYFTKMMMPKNKITIGNPMKTFSKFQPHKTMVSEIESINEFLRHLDEFKLLLEKSREIDLNKAKVKSALGSILLFKIGDAFCFVSAHNQRHLVQVQNAIKNAEHSLTKT